MDLLIKLLMYGVAIGCIILYFFMQRRRQSNYRQTFNENYKALEVLTQKLPLLTHEEEVALITYFLECYWVFEGIIFPDFLDGLYPDVVQSAPAWEVRALQLRELQSEQRITQQQLDILLDIKHYILFVETIRWPGVSYHEEEFFEASQKKILVYYETMHELLAMMEQE